MSDYSLTLYITKVNGKKENLFINILFILCILYTFHPILQKKNSKEPILFFLNTLGMEVISMNFYRSSCGDCCPRICYVPCPVHPTTPTARPYASFLTNGTAVTSGTSLTFTPQINKGGTLITGGGTTALTLAARHIYQVDYTVNGTSSSAGLVQITPYLNGVAATYGQANEVTQASPNNQFTLHGSFLVDTTNAPVTLNLRYTGAGTATFTGNVIVHEIDTTSTTTAY